MSALYRLLAGAVMLAGVAACGESAAPSSSSSGPSVGSAGANLGTAAVKISATDGLKFDPADQPAKVGDIIQWNNTATVTHTISFDDQPALSDAALSAGGSWQVKFTTAGTYQYHCTIHAGMNGTLTVS